MHELERKANKHFKVFTDYDKRQVALEDHAIKLVLSGPGGRNPNLPMIPAPESAHFRSHCESCGTIFWGHQAEFFCDKCKEFNEEEQRLQAELSRLERVMRIHGLKQRVEKLKQDGESLDEELARLVAT